MGAAVAEWSESESRAGTGEPELVFSLDLGQDLELEFPV